MQFYNRDTELEQLEGIRKQSLKSAQFTVLTGRRRIGKTHFLLHANKDKPVLYFFVARKSESLLCLDFTEEIRQKLNLPVIGETNRFIKLFEVLMEHSKEHPFTLIIDEFQEFYHVAPSVFSEIQHYWDIHHNDSRINLIVSGSVFSMMHKIFENAKEPLFGRAGHFIRMQAFQTEVIKHILTDHNPSWSPDDLLALFMFTGGVPKYIKLFMDAGACTKQSMIDQMICENSPFLNEGKSILIEEFGKE
ncbi:MAG: ATP-binding protein, partial [Bacteroidetes bacterium]|nr:ATP-binding protein [Bacteroidota bacterium]